MANYGGMQLPNINEKSMDSQKERKQILNYLALLDEKLRYMFQNIDIEENLSDDSRELFFKYGEDIQNVIKDTEGNFSVFQQKIDNITVHVQDAEGNIAQLQITADGLATRVSAAEIGVSEVMQTAAGIGTRVTNLEGAVSTVEHTANSIRTTVSNLGGDIDDLTEEVETAYSMAEQAADHFSWIVGDESDASEIKLTSNMITAITEQVEIQADVRLYGEMKLYSSSTGSIYGGWLSYGEGNNGSDDSATGVLLSSKDKYSYFIATNSGVRMTYDDEYAVHCTSNGVTLVGDYDFRAATNFFCTSTNKSSLGTSNYKWANIYATTSSIGSSDAREKNSIDYDMSRYEEFFADLKPVSYKFNEGTSGRFHVGFISQDIEENMNDKGLDSKDFAGFIKSPVYAAELENGEADTNSDIVDYRYGLRYGEFVALNTHMIQKLMARVEELENKVEALS